ncbi:hypothetical protein D9M70_432630 [compost metagenome]
MGLSVTPPLLEWLEPGIEYRDQVDVGEVAQVAAGFLLPERSRRHAVEALPALGHALDQLQAHGQGVLDGSLGAQQQLAAVGVEVGDLVLAEEEPAEAGQQRAEHAGGHAAAVEQAPVVVRQGAEHQHRGAEQGDQKIGNVLRLRAESETRQAVARAQRGELGDQRQADQGDAAELAEPAAALADHRQDQGEAEQAGDNRQLAAHSPVATDQRNALVAAAGQHIVREAVAGEGDQGQAGEPREPGQAAGGAQQCGAGEEAEQGAVGQQCQVLAGRAGQDEEGGQAGAAQRDQGECQAVQVGLEDERTVVLGHGVAPFRWLGRFRVSGVIRPGRSPPAARRRRCRGVPGSDRGARSPGEAARDAGVRGHPAGHAPAAAGAGFPHAAGRGRWRLPGRFRSRSSPRVWRGNDRFRRG